MSSLLRTIVCCLALSAAGSVLAADSAPSAAPAPADAAHAPPPLLQRPHAGKLKHLDKSYAVPVVAHRRTDGSLEIRSGGPLPTAASQAEVHDDR